MVEVLGARHVGQVPGRSGTVPPAVRRMQPHANRISASLRCAQSRRTTRLPLSTYARHATCLVKVMQHLKSGCGCVGAQAIASDVGGGRTPQEALQRWTRRGVGTAIKKGRWDKDEDQALIQVH